MAKLWSYITDLNGYYGHVHVS